jgi:hypothetical protein
MINITINLQSVSTANKVKFHNTVETFQITRPEAYSYEYYKLYANITNANGERRRIEIPSTNQITLYADFAVAGNLTFLFEFRERYNTSNKPIWDTNSIVLTAMTSGIKEDELEIVSILTQDGNGSQFLANDGTYKTIQTEGSGTGDMLISVYDPDNDGIVNQAEEIVDDEHSYTATDIYTNLQGKSDVNHTHTESNISDLDKYTKLETDTLLNAKADSSHSHGDLYYTESETDTLLNAKSNNGHTHTEYSETTHNHINDYAPLAHTHNDLYYSESEIDLLLADKSDTTHTHTDYLTDAPSDTKQYARQDATWVEVATGGGTSAVSSVAGKTGDVILEEADISDLDKYSQSEVDTLLSDYSLTTHDHDLSYANITHNHVKADITDFSDSDYATSTHNHDLDYADVLHTHTDLHTHTNKTLLDSLTSSGDGTQYLSNNGTYQTVSGGGGTADTTQTFVAGSDITANQMVEINDIGEAIPATTYYNTSGNVLYTDHLVNNTGLLTSNNYSLPVKLTENKVIIFNPYDVSGSHMLKYTVLYVNTLTKEQRILSTGTLSTNDAYRTTACAIRVSDNQVLFCASPASSLSGVIANLISVDNYGNVSVLSTVTTTAYFSKPTAITRLTDDSFVLTGHTTSSTNPMAVVITIASNVLSVGTAHTFTLANTTYTDVKRLSDTKCIAYWNNSTTFYFYILTISGTTITKSSAYTVSAGNGHLIQYNSADLNKLLFIYTGTGLSAVPVSVAGDYSSISFGTPVSNLSITASMPNAHLTAENQVSVLQQSDTGIASVITNISMASDTISYMNTQNVSQYCGAYGFYSVMFDSYDILTTNANTTTGIIRSAFLSSVKKPNNIIGIATQTSTTGNNVVVSYANEQETFADLTIGSKYYLQADATLGLQKFDNREFMGVSASATNMNLKINDINPYNSLNVNNNNLMFKNQSLRAGLNCLTKLSTGQGHTALGIDAGRNVTTGNYNVAIGYQPLSGGSSITANNCVGIGYSALSTVTSGHYSIGIGGYALTSLAGANTGNVALGYDALRYLSSTSNSTAIGTQALKFTTSGASNTNYANCVGLGYDTRVSASNQIQLGDSSTNVYLFGSVNDRSDMRDKADIIDNPLGLDFILALQPKQFKWNYRDDYYVEMPVLNENGDPTYDEHGDPITELVFDQANYDLQTLKRNRSHNGFIAQDIKALIDNEIIDDFAGLQCHNMQPDGCDIKTIAYTEIISPMVKAIQEQQEIINSLKARIEALEG